jgi:hypothetical protein
MSLTASKIAVGTGVATPGLIREPASAQSVTGVGFSEIAASSGSAGIGNAYNAPKQDYRWSFDTEGRERKSAPENKPNSAAALPGKFFSGLFGLSTANMVQFTMEFYQDPAQNRSLLPTEWSQGIGQYAKNIRLLEGVHAGHDVAQARLHFL